MNHLLKSYPRFWLKSTNAHGVHSPFVYDWVTRCLYDKKDYAAYRLIKAYHKAMRSNHHSIEVKDFGAGSRVFSPNKKRKVSAIAKQAGSTLKRSQLLYRICRYFDIKQAVELGTSLGLGSIGMAANSGTQVHSFEACQATAKLAQNQMQKMQRNNWQLHLGLFKDTLKQLPDKIDLAFIDGHHDEQATYAYFCTLLAHKHNNSVFIIDDIYWSAGMQRAWERIKKHPEVRISIDCFYWGLVFFRAEQAREEFTIRM